jgi:hypothetical protein
VTKNRTTLPFESVIFSVNVSAVPGSPPSWKHHSAVPVSPLFRRPVPVP